MLGLKSKSFKTFGKKITGYGAMGLKHVGKFGQYAGAAATMVSPMLLASPDPISKGLGFVAGSGGGAAVYGAGTALRMAGSGLEKLSA